MLSLPCLHEAINRPFANVGFFFVCILCLISFGFLIAASFTCRERYDFRCLQQYFYQSIAYPGITQSGGESIAG